LHKNKLHNWFDSDLTYILFFIILIHLVAHGFGFLIWFTYAPLLIYIYKKPFKEIIIFGSIFLILHTIIEINWIRLYDLKTLALVSLIYVSFLLLFLLTTKVVIHKTKKITKTKFWFLILFYPAIIWYVYSLVYTIMKVGGFWTDLAMFQPMTAPLIWYIGGRGITFIIITCNTMISMLFTPKMKKNHKKTLLALIIVVILSVFVCRLYCDNNEPIGKTVTVAAVQGNFPQGWDWRVEHADKEIIETYINLTEQAGKYKPNIIVWPEYSIPAEINKKSNLSNLLSFTANHLDAYLIFGSLKWYDKYINGQREKNDVVVVISPEGNLLYKYISIRPLPYETWTLSGKDIGVADTEIANIGLLSCYEENLAKLSRDITTNNAEFILILANNQRFRKTNGIHLASLQSRLRAAENYKYVVRVTNTGTTQVINPYGKIIAKAKPFERTLLIANIKPNNVKTFYSLYNEIILQIFIVLIIIGTLFVYNRKEQVKDPEQEHKN